MSKHPLLIVGHGDEPVHHGLIAVLVVARHTCLHRQDIRQWVRLKQLVQRGGAVVALVLELDRLDSDLHTSDCQRVFGGTGLG